MKIGHILLLALTSQFLHAQLQVRNYFSVTGRKDVSVNALAQDRTGFLWLGTNEGLYKFDGRSPAHLITDSVLIKKDITALHIDPAQRVWIGTRSGSVYCYRGNTLDSINFSPERNTERITSICDIDSGICISTYGNGIYGYKDKQLQHLTTRHGLSDNVVYKAMGAAGSLWCATDAGVTRIAGIFGRRKVVVISNKNGLPDNIVRDVEPSGERLLIAMQDSGLCYYNPVRKKIERERFFMNWSLGTVINAFTAGNGKLLVATEKNGLLRIDRGRIEVYKYEDYNLGPVNLMLVDNASQVWIASRRGISVFGEKRFNFIGSRNGLEDEKVLALARDNDNAIWIGTAMGISRLTANEQGKTEVRSFPELSKFTISCAANGPGGEIWFGTYGSGIIILGPAARKPVIITSKNGGISNENISGIFFENDSMAYISTLGGGVNHIRIKRHNNELSVSTATVYREGGGLGSDYVYAALTDKNGSLFVATDGGGLQQLKDGKFNNLTRERRYGSSTVYSLCRDSLNVIWSISNSDGILRYDGKTFTRFNRASGLRDDQPQQIICSGSAIFALHGKGIDKINCNDLSISHYDVFEGDLEPNLNAITFSNNRIYSGTNNGILIFRTSIEKLDSTRPSAYLKSVLLFFKPFALDSSREFSHSDNSFNISFDGVWLKNPEKLVFRYKLEGLEEEWLWSEGGKQINYNNLGPGSYTFIVQSKNEEDVWSEPATFSFVILKPIWQHWWFWAIVIVAASLSFYLFVRYRLQSLRKENLVLERKVKERTSEIEQQSRIIEMKNHELEQLSLVASKTDNAVLILDPGGKLEYVNESFIEQNARPREGSTIFELSNNPNIRELVEDAITNKKSVNYESQSRNQDDTRQSWQSSTLTPIFDDGGALKKIIIIDTDVTERKRQEQIIVQKNKDITDSISYARKIQHAILPDLRLIRKHIPHSFILYMTKDIVSGDFYWYTHLDECSIIAAVDCTGHGVPGAFMSLIGYNVLNRIVNENRITDPQQILSELNKGVVAVLHKNESESKDGMDIAICRIDHQRQVLHYAGAMRPLWIINNGELKEVPPDKTPIGTRPADRKSGIKYHTHEIPVIKGDRYYIFTDGYSDQFGGERDKKFSSARFRNLLKEISHLEFEKQELRLREEHYMWKGGNEQVDDILVIGFSV